MEENYYVYILANRDNNVFYVGVTNNLIKKIWEHKSKLVEGFTKKYNVNKLVYYETFTDIKEAILREKKLKKWKKDWKIALIKKENPEWEDLYEKIIKQ